MIELCAVFSNMVLSPIITLSKTFLYLLCVCLCGCMGVTSWVRSEVYFTIRNRFFPSTTLLPGIELSSQTWWQKTTPTEPSPLPYLSLQMASSSSLTSVKLFLPLIQLSLLTFFLIFTALSMEFGSCLLVCVSYDNF